MGGGVGHLRGVISMTRASVRSYVGHVNSLYMLSQQIMQCSARLYYSHFLHKLVFKLSQSVELSVINSLKFLTTRENYISKPNSAGYEFYQ